MASRNHTFEIGQYYHVYNRGTDKREIISDQKDLDRFIYCLQAFNTLEPIGSIYWQSFKTEKRPLRSKAPKLVDIVAYCVNPNHFHLLITPFVDKGIEKFMQRIGGYPKYYNEKYKRSGSLFQGKFKSKHISDNRYLLHVSAYINLNNCDELGCLAPKLSKSSFPEYLSKFKIGFCNPSMMLGQFSSKKAYEKFALGSWQDTCKRKKDQKEDEIFLNEFGI